MAPRSAILRLDPPHSPEEGLIAMRVFDARAEYTPSRDVRDHRELLKLLKKPPQRSVLYPLIGARRAGKTWTLRALELLQNGKKSPIMAQYLNLMQLGGDLPSKPPARCLLLDEPELTGDGSRRRGARDFLAWCRSQKEQGATLLLAMSPAEWDALRAADEAGTHVSVQDLRFLDALTPAQAGKLARTDQAQRILAGLPPAWQRSPFLLELVFQMAEDVGPDAEKDLWELLRQTRNRSERIEFFYFKAVFQLGLTDPQRASLRAVAEGNPLDGSETELLERCNLLEKQAGGHAIADPILAANLCPLRIHHLSDIHFGPKAGERVDIKEAGAHANAMAKGLGPKHVADHYVDHVRELRSKGRAPHLVVISGDVAEWATEDEYAAARAWLDELQPLLAEHPRIPLDARNVLVAGGNHDVDWKTTGGAAGYRTRHLAFARAFDGVPRALRTRLEEPPDTRALAVERYADLGVEIVLLGSAEFGGEIEKDSVREEMLGIIEGLRKRALEETDEKKADALRTKVSRIDPGLVHNRDLERLRQDRSLHPVKIAVLHHPVSPLPFTELARFAGLVNAGELKDALVEREVCLVLHGHAHMGWFAQEQWPERETPWVLRIAAAPSLGSREINEQNGYNEITIVRSPHAIVVRRVVRKGASWEPAKTMGPFAPGA